MSYKKELRFNGLACRTNRGYPSEAEFKSASILIGHLPIQTGLLPYIGSFHAAKIGIFQLSSNFSPFISVFTPKSVSFQTFLFPIGTGPRGYHLGHSERKQHFSLVFRSLIRTFADDHWHDVQV